MPKKRACVVQAAPVGGRPPSVDEYLTELNQIDRRLAAIILVSTSWAEVRSYGYKPNANFTCALMLLSPTEQERFYALVTEHLRGVRSSKEMAELGAILPAFVKKRAWKLLSLAEQQRLTALVPSKNRG